MTDSTHEAAALAITATISDAAFDALTVHGADVVIGEPVVIYGRGRLRAAICEKVGRVNITALFTTPTAVAEGVERMASAKRDIAAQGGSAAWLTERKASADAAAIERLAHIDETQVPGYDGYYHFNDPEAAKVSTEESRIARHADLAATAAGADANDLSKFVGFTRKSAKFADVRALS